MKIQFCRFAINVLIAFFLVFVSIVPQETNVRPLAGYNLFRSAALAQSNGKIYNVKQLGARGDGVSDDTAAIQRVIDAAPNGSTIYFPAGTYTVSNFRVNKRSGLSFTGEERKSVIRQKAGAERIATFDGSSDITITKLAFDANSVARYGGVMFYAVKGVRIEDNFFFDRAPKPVGQTDRYAFVFGKGGAPSQDVKILKNVIEDLQLEVDHSQRVLIDGNTVSGSVQAAGIGIFTVGDGAIAEDYQITRNRVVNPHGSGFRAIIDPPKSRNCVFRRITIANNEVIQNKKSIYGVQIGTPDSSQATSGNVFEDIIIKDNRITIEQNAPAPRQMIFANSSAAAGIVFKRLIITGNEIVNDGPKNTGYAIDLRRIQNSVVADNNVKAVANGISIGGDLLANEVRDNAVNASDVAYAVQGSLGGNKVANNRIVGNPRERWKLSTLKPTDSIETKAHERKAEH